MPKNPTTFDWYSSLALKLAAGAVLTFLGLTLISKCQADVRSARSLERIALVAEVLGSIEIQKVQRRSAEPSSYLNAKY